MSISNYPSFAVRSLTLIIFALTLAAQSFTSGQSVLPKSTNTVSLSKLCTRLEKLEADTFSSTIKDRETHCYFLTADSKSYIDLTVFQKDSDIGLRVYTKANRTNSPVNEEEQENWKPSSPNFNTVNTKRQKEYLSLITKEKTDFLLLIVPLKVTASSSYSLVIERRPAIYETDIFFQSSAYRLLEVYNQAVESNNGLEKLKQAEKVFNEVRSDRNYSAKLTVRQLEAKQNLLLLMGSLFMDFPVFHKTALESFKELAELSRILGDKDYEGEAFRGLGFVYIYSEPKEAINAFRRSADLFREAADFENQILALAWAGKAADDLGVVTLAAEIYEEAVKVKRDQLSIARANLLLNLSVAYMKQGLLDQSLEANKESERIYLAAEKSVGDQFQQDKAYLYHNMARVYMAFGDDATAVSYLNKALSFSTPDGKTKYYDAAAYEHLFLGVIRQREGKYDESDQEFMTAFNLWGEMIRRLEDKNNELDQAENKYNQQANAIYNIAENYVARGEREKSILYYEKALALQNKAFDTFQKSRILSSIAIVRADQGDLENARKFSTEALQLTKASSVFEARLKALYAAAYVENAKSNFSEAEKHIKEADELIKLISANMQISDLKEGFSSSVYHVYELYVDILMQQAKRSNDKKFAELALQVSDGARARRLVEILQSDSFDFGKNVPLSSIQKVKQLQTEMAILLSQRRLLANLSNPDNERQRKLENEISQTIENLRQVKLEIKKLDPQYSALYNPDPLTARQIGSLLPPDTCFVEFSIGKDRSYAWFVTDKEIHAYPLLENNQPVTRLELEKLTRNAVGKIQELNENNEQTRSDPAFVEYRNLSSRLSRILLGPIAGKIRGKRLVVSADGIIHYIPFSALPVPDNSSEWVPLIKQNEITAVPSANALIAILQKKRITPAKYLAGFISPLYRTGVGADKNPSNKLSGAVRKNSEIENLAFGGNLINRLNQNLGKRNLFAKSILPTGPQVNRTAVTGADLKDFRFLLFYTHGVFDSYRPESSGIYLSFYNSDNTRRPDSFLGLNDIYSLNLNADVVFLSGCETLLGKEIKGEGLVGLTRGFMHAGSKNVISSFWKVPEYETMLLVDRFFQKVTLENARPLAALRDIQLEMWEVDKLPPFYWAGFQANGVW